jgi:hypothetical protein
MRKALVFGLFLGTIFAVSATAENSLARFEGGIGVIPVSNVAGDPVIINNVTTFPNVTRNVVRNINPGGQPWVISALSVDVKLDGRISADGRGLLLAGGNNIGTNGGQSVKASLFCGPAATATEHTSDTVPLEANGDFRIDGILNPAPPAPCSTPVLLIRSGAGAWFAAGIPRN